MPQLHLVKLGLSQQKLQRRILYRKYLLPSADS